MNYVVYALRASMALQAWTAIPAMLYDYHREQWLKYLGVKSH
jgi:hypothetical protein